MPIYEYKCRNCGVLYERTSLADAIPCSSCGYLARRFYGSIQIQPSGGAFKPHFNHAVGRYVSTSREFDHALARHAEDNQTIYTRVDPGDVPAPDKDTEILETQMSTLSRKGFMSESGKVPIDDAGDFIRQ